MTGLYSEYIIIDPNIINRQWLHCYSLWRRVRL